LGAEEDGFHARGAYFVDGYGFDGGRKAHEYASLSSRSLVDRSDSSEVKRIAIKYMRKGGRMHIFDTNLRMLTPQTCFEAVAVDGRNTILLIPERELDTDNPNARLPLR